MSPPYLTAWTVRGEPAAALTWGPEKLPHVGGLPGQVTREGAPGRSLET